LTTLAPIVCAAQERFVAQELFTFDDLKGILVNRVGLPPEQVIDEPSQQFEDMGLDSLAFIEIQLAIQQQYGFTIPDEDASHITNQGQAIEYVNRRLQEG
jgi:acyl carrier protein